MFDCCQDFEKWKEVKDERLIEMHKKAVEKKHREHQAEREKKKEKEKENDSAFKRWSVAGPIFIKKLKCLFFYLPVANENLGSIGKIQYK